MKVKKFVYIGILFLSFFTGWYMNDMAEICWERNEIAEQSISKALQLKSAYGDIEACHPKVIAFSEPWNGYSYWISFSPYPQADDSKENPHILASNDLINWVEPKGFENPLEDTPDRYFPGLVYNSDPELVYNSDADNLECWWRFVDDETGNVIIYRSWTNDGVHWSDKEIMIQSIRKNQDFVSPALLYEDGKYKMWSVGSGYQVQYMESKDGYEWSDIRFIDIEYNFSNLKSWHLSMTHDEVYGYELLISAFDSEADKSRRAMNLYYTKSNDNINYDKAEAILVPMKSNWNNRGLYRSSLIHTENDVYYLFYSGIGENGSRGIGLMVGENIEDLREFSFTEQ